MTIEVLLTEVLGALVDDRVWPDVAPDKTPTPYITWQQVGGGATNFLEGGSVGIRMPRIQVNVWHSNRQDANELAKDVEDAIRAESSLQAEVLGDFVATHEPDTKLYGTRQDFRLVE